jgi:hypothetical protein
MYEEYYTKEGRFKEEKRSPRDNRYMWACHEFVSKISIYCFYINIMEYELQTPKAVHEWLKIGYNMDTTIQPTEVFEEMLFKYNQLVSHYFDVAIPTRSEFKQKGKHLCLKEAIDRIDELGWSR